MPKSRQPVKVRMRARARPRARAEGFVRTPGPEAAMASDRRPIDKSLRGWTKRWKGPLWTISINPTNVQS